MHGKKNGRRCGESALLAVGRQTKFEMEVTARHHEPIETESFRVSIHGNEFLFKESPDGLHIVEVTDDVIMVQPQTANSIVLITKDKTQRKKR